MAPLSPSVNLLVFFFVISRDRSSKIVRGNPLRRSMEMITYREPSCKSPYKGAQFMNVGTFWCCLLASLPRPPILGTSRFPGLWRQAQEEEEGRGTKAADWGTETALRREPSWILLEFSRC